MKTLCQCGHAKSQHHVTQCDYAGYSCNCTGYKTAADYETRVRAYEAQGMTRSDAQAVADADDMKRAR